MNKTILIPIFIIIAIILIFGLVSPQYKTYNEKLGQAKAKEAEVQSVRAYYSDVDKISEELAKYSAEITKMDLALPDEISAAAVSDYFQKKVSESGLILKDYVLPVTSIQSPLNASLKESNVSLSLSASYPALKNFIYNLGESARMVEVEKISFLSSDSKNLLLNIGLSLKLYSY
jgi:Tfp pilus assembly protein PilO